MQELEADEVESLIRIVPNEAETVFDFLDEAGESVKTVRIERRKLQPELPRVLPQQPIDRNDARSHVFNDVDAFAKYLQREANASRSLILADVAARTINAVLDEGIEEDRETVSLRAVEHPLFSPWAEMIGKPVPVDLFAMFCMQNRRAIKKPDGRELALVFSQVKMSKKVTVSTGVGKKALNGVVCEVQIAGERQDQIVELPETITIEAPLFVGTEPQTIEIDLLVTEKGDQPVVYATAADVEQQRIVAFESMIERIAEATGQLVGLGRVQHRGWKLQPME